MKRPSIIGLLALLLLSSSAGAYAQDAAEVAAPSDELPIAFGGVAADAVSESVKVTAINAEKRIVTLENAAGVSKDVECGPQVVNFSQIQVGDTVTVTVAQFAEVMIAQDTNEALSRKEEFEIAGAPRGEKPKGTVTRTVKVMAVVDEINYESREVVLQGPQERVKLKVGPEAVNFDKVNKGDQVYMELTEITQVMVTTPEF